MQTGTHLCQTTGRLEAGRIRLRSWPTMQATLRDWPDSEVFITIERKTARRSDAANRYYFAVVVKTISDYTGYSPDETHQALKALHLPKHLAFADGNGEVVGELVIGGSTRVLNNIEFGDFISRVRVWAQDVLGITIPDAART